MSSQRTRDRLFPNARVTTGGERKTKTTKGRRSNNTEFFDGRRAVHRLGAGDSFYMPNFLKRTEAHEMLASILDEAALHQMFNVTPDAEDHGVEPIPRLVTAQTDDGVERRPIYRMPGCNQRNIPTTPWTPTVDAVRTRASAEVGQELNHCVATLYRDEHDSLGFHRDKLLDLAPDSLILSVSLGAPRPILFYSLDGEDRASGGGKQHKQTVVLQHGSLLAIGPKTNRRYKHAIPKLSERTAPRVSLSLRTIASFQQKADGSISGQGRDHQTAHWPFAKNFDDDAAHSVETRQEMAAHAEEAKLTLQRCQWQVAHGGHHEGHGEEEDDEIPPVVFL